MKRNEVTTETGTHYLDDQGIVHITSFQGVEETLDQAKASIAAIRTVSENQRRPILLDMRPIKGQKREVRDYYASSEAADAYTAAAILVGSPISRMIGNIFIGIGKLPVPTKLFSNEEEAIEWLKGYMG
jgi:SpoIIAA-like